MKLRFHTGLFMGLVAEVWPLLRALAGVLIALLVGVCLAWGLSDALRYAGTMLQVFGLGTVAAGIHQLRKNFGRPPVGEVLRGWVRHAKAIFVKPEPVSASGSGSVRVTGSAFGRVSTKLSVGAPLHERITLLERQIETLWSALDHAERALQADITSTREASESGLRERAAEIATTDAKLQDLAVGGVRLEITGLIWLFVGTILAGVPNEVAALIQRFW